VRPYTHTDHYWQVYFDTNEAIVRVAREAGWPAPTPVQINRIAPGSRSARAASRQSKARDAGAARLPNQLSQGPAAEAPSPAPAIIGEKLIQPAG
jgi:hypothetical protein